MLVWIGPESFSPVAASTLEMIIVYFLSTAQPVRGMIVNCAGVVLSNFILVTMFGLIEYFMVSGRMFLLKVKVMGSTLHKEEMVSSGGSLCISSNGLMLWFWGVGEGWTLRLFFGLLFRVSTESRTINPLTKTISLYFFLDWEVKRELFNGFQIIPQ